MEIIDIIILVFLGILVILGFRKGFIISLASLVALILGIYFALFFSDLASDVIRGQFEVSSTYLPVISFVVTFILVLVVILLLGKLLEKIVDSVGIGFLNHVAGALFGLVKGALLLSILFFVITYADPREKVITETTKEKSFLYTRVASIFPALLRWTGTADLIEK